MLKMKNLIWISIFFISTITSFSQEKKAKDLLDEVTAKVKSYENIAIDFKYSLQNTKENINQDSKGNVVLKGNLYYLNLVILKL